METLTILCATRNRLVKLQNMIASIKTGWVGAPIKLMLACDGDAHTHRWAIKNNIESFYFAQQQGSVFCRNFLANKTIDSILYAVDDMIFRDKAITIAFEHLLTKFPDTDGVVGFTQTGNNSFSPTGVAIVGRKFVDRFPNRQFLCPEFFHFAAQEVHRVALHLERFFLAPDAIIHHFHPEIDRKLMDRTHVDARIHKKRDMEVRKRRAEQGQLWGIS